MNKIKEFLINKIKKFPIITHVVRLMMDATLKFQKPIMTCHGFKLTGNKSMMSGNFEPIETNVIKTILEKSNVFINVGANIGYYVLHSIKSGCEVNIAIEPIKSNVKCLINNLRANDWDKLVEIYPIAVGNKIGIVKIFGVGTGASTLPGWADSSKYLSKMVPLNILDNIVGNRFSGKECCILMDIEGAELYAIEGAKKLLSQEPKPVWVVEICINEHLGFINPNLLKTFELFFNNGYEAWTCEEKPRLVSLLEVQAIHDTKIDTLLTHNFIFKNSKKNLG
jgi:FkbM family methyltransferase